MVSKLIYEQVINKTHSFLVLVLFSTLLVPKAKIMKMSKKLKLKGY